MAKAEKIDTNVQGKTDDFAEKNEVATGLSLPNAPPPSMEDDLPEEVKKQLVGYSEMELEKTIIDSLSAAGTGVITVDKIVLSLWHRHKRVVERPKLIRTLNLLAERNIIIKNDSPRGYRMPETSKPKIAE